MGDHGKQKFDSVHIVSTFCALNDRRAYFIMVSQAQQNTCAQEA